MPAERVVLVLQPGDSPLLQLGHHGVHQLVEAVWCEVRDEDVAVGRVLLHVPVDVSATDDGVPTNAVRAVTSMMSCRMESDFAVASSRHSPATATGSLVCRTRPRVMAPVPSTSGSSAGSGPSGS